MTDIEIARKTKLENIDKIAKKLGIEPKNIFIIIHFIHPPYYILKSVES